MTRTRGSTENNCAIKHSILHKLYHLYNQNIPEEHSRFIAIATGLLDYTRGTVADLVAEYKCPPNCKGELVFGVNKEPHHSQGTLALMESGKHILEGSERNPTVQEFQEAVNLDQVVNAEFPIHMSLRRTYKILDYLDYSSKFISGVMGISDENAQKKRMVDLKKFRGELTGMNDMMSLIFVDEASLNLRDLLMKMRRISKKGHKSYGDVVNLNMPPKSNPNMIVFLTIGQPLHVLYDIKSTDSTSFENAMRDYIENTDMSHMHFVLDNANIHAKDLMDGLVDSYHGVSYSFLPRASPECNPAEYVHEPLKLAITEAWSKIPALNGPQALQTCKSVCESYDISPEERFNCVRHGMEVIAAMINLPYKEAVEHVRDESKRRRREARN